MVHATGLSNGVSPPGLLSEYRARQRASLGELSGTALAAIPSIRAWRRAFTAFGVKPTRYRNAAEALLRRLVKHGAIPPINLLVDIANLVSIRYRLPAAAFDQAAVIGETEVRFAHGDERFTDLGTTEAVSPSRGEVVFADQAGVVGSRRWCWRQSAQSAVGPDTAEALFTVEGHHAEAHRDVSDAAGCLVDLLERYQPGAAISSAILSPGNPRFAVNGP